MVLMSPNGNWSVEDDRFLKVFARAWWKAKNSTNYTWISIIQHSRNDFAQILPFKDQVLQSEKEMVKAMKQLNWNLSATESRTMYKDLTDNYKVAGTLNEKFEEMDGKIYMLKSSKRKFKITARLYDNGTNKVEFKFLGDRDIHIMLLDDFNQECKEVN